MPDVADERSPKSSDECTACTVPCSNCHNHGILGVDLDTSVPCQEKGSLTQIRLT